MQRNVKPLAPMKTLLFGLAWLAAVSFCHPVFAQGDSLPPRVTKVVNLTREHEGRLCMGDYICVNVHNLAQLLAAHSGDTNAIVLYMDGMPMSGLQATFSDSCDTAVYFHMKRSTGTDPWDVFYCSPMTWVKRNMQVSVGYNGECMLPSASRMDFVIIREGYFFIALVLALLLIALFVYAAKKGMLKNDCVLPLAQKAYSLSRTQLAVWTMIIAVSYIMIALVTGELVPLTTSTLILLGISGATAAAANVIDSNDKQNNKVRHQDVIPTKGLLNDLLCDSNGVSVHRFQMIVFNLILCVFFVKEVFTTLQMPDFDNNLLILMGLSNTTYAGLKTNENNTTAQAMPGTMNTSMTNMTDTTGAPTEEDMPPVG